MRHLLPARFKLPIWFCPICNGPFKKVSPCPKCIQLLKPASAGYPSLFTYDLHSRRLIYGIKYRNILSPISWIADQYLVRVPQNIDVITWIPASKSQKRKRGYDQCRLLAEAISKRLNIPHLQLLKRKNDTPQTHKKSQAERAKGPKLYGRRLLKSDRAPLTRVLLIDDVITTGTSIGLGKQILESQGNVEVHVLGIACSERKQQKKVYQQG